jgi:hypothetical protein
MLPSQLGYEGTSAFIAIVPAHFGHHPEPILGPVFSTMCWLFTSSSSDLIAEADAMHELLVHRADNLEGRSEGSPEQAELASIVGVNWGIRRKALAVGKVAGGKG